MESIYFYWSFQGGTFVVVFVVICLGVKFFVLFEPYVGFSHF